MEPRASEVLEEGKNKIGYLLQGQGTGLYVSAINPVVSPGRGPQVLRPTYLERRGTLSSRGAWQRELGSEAVVQD